MNLPRWFAERSLGLRAVLVVLAALVAVNLAVYGVRLVGGGSQPSGVTASAHATAPDGYAAWAELLRRYHRKVVLLDQYLADAHLPAGATVVVAEPEGFSAEDAQALTDVVERGGRVVLVGRVGARLLAAGGNPSLAWSDGPAGRASVLAPVPATRGVTQVQVGEGRFEGVGALLPILGRDGRAVAVVGHLGAGEVVAVASPEVFDNAHLGQLDDASFALGVTGSTGATVYFDEADHGYGPSTGLATLPSGWRWAAAGLLLAALVALWVRGKRLGPAEDLERPLAPPRRLHVDALAAALARSRDVTGAGDSLWHSVRSDLARTAGVSVTDERFEQTAKARAVVAGVSEAELGVLDGPPRDADGLVALGSVSARLSRSRSIERPTGGTP